MISSIFVAIGGIIQVVLGFLSLYVPADSRQSLKDGKKDTKSKSLDYSFKPVIVILAISLIIITTILACIISSTEGDLVKLVNSFTTGFFFGLCIAIVLAVVGILLVAGFLFFSFIAGAVLREKLLDRSR